MKHALALIILLLTSVNAYSNTNILELKSWEHAKEIYETSIGPIVATLDNSENYRVISRDEFDYKPIEIKVSKIHSILKRKYPLEIVFDNPAFVLIIDCDKQNALVTPELKTYKNINLIILNKGIFELSDDSLTGVVAHELVHASLQYLKEGLRHPNDKYYYSNNQISFGKNIKNNKKLEKTITLLQELRNYAGPFSNFEFRGIPLHYNQAGSSDYRVLIHLLSNATYSPVCISAVNSFNEYVNDLLVKNFSYDTLKFKDYSEEKRNSILKSSASLELLVGDCLSDKNYNYEILLMEVFKVDNFHRKEIFNQMEREIMTRVSTFFSSKSVGYAFIELTSAFRKEIRDIEQSTDLTRARIYNYEDHADEVAMVILKELNISPDGFSSFIIRNLRNGNCDYKGDNIPAYGGFEDKHHFACWRAYRNHKYYLSLFKN